MEQQTKEYNLYTEYLQDIESKSFDIVRDSDYASYGHWDEEIKSFLDAMTLKSLFFSEDWVFICVDLIANKISSQYLYVFKEEIVDGQPQITKAQNHPVQKRIEEPNQFQDYHSFMYSCAVDLPLLGNSVIWDSRSTNQLIPIGAETIGMNFDRSGRLENYYTNQFNFSDGNYNRSETSQFIVDEIIHCKRPNPSSLLWGMSPFTPGRKSVLFNRYSTEYLNNFYLKGASPGLALEMANEANPQIMLRMLRSFEQAYTGRRNQRRTLVLPKGVTAKQISSSLADQQLVQYIDKNRETIINLFKIPKHEVGLQTAGSLGSEEYKTAIRNFWSATLIPMMRIIEGEFTRHFQSQLGPEYFIAFDMTAVDALKDDEQKKALLAKEMLSVHTINEIRSKLYDLPPVDGGDTVASLKPQSLMPVGYNLSPTESKAEEPKEITEAIEIKPTQSNDRLKAFIETNKDWYDKREKKVLEESKRGIDELERKAIEMYLDISSGVLRAMRKYLEEKRYIKAAEFVSKVEMRRRIRDAINSYESKWIDDTREILTAHVDLGYDLSLDLPFKLPNREAVQALRAKNENKRRELLEARGLRSFEMMNQAMTERVMKKVESGVDQGKTIDEITREIAEDFRSDESVGYRANRIARTETLTAVSIGQAAAMSDAATVIPDLKKVWMNAGDIRVRGNPNGLYPDSKADHWELDGQVRSYDKAFSNGLMYPRDTSGPPDQVINCRCSFLMAPADEIKDLVEEM